MVFHRFSVDFGSILGGFQAVRASAQDLGGFWASAQGLYIAVSAAFPAWVGTYTTNDKSGLQSRKTAATGGQNKPKTKARHEVQTIGGGCACSAYLWRAFVWVVGWIAGGDREPLREQKKPRHGGRGWCYFVFLRISDSITRGSTTTQSKTIFQTSLRLMV